SVGADKAALGVGSPWIQNSASWRVHALRRPPGPVGHFRACRQLRLLHWAAPRFRTSWLKQHAAELQRLSRHRLPADRPLARQHSDAAGWQKRTRTDQTGRLIGPRPALSSTDGWTYPGFPAALGSGGGSYL